MPTPNDLVALNPTTGITTTSLIVAQHFGKNHFDVLRSIRQLECSEEFHQRNFALMFYFDKAGQGAQRKQPMYTMTKDGFMFLAMGFTGPQAARWKETFIDAFNALAEQVASGLAYSQEELHLLRRAAQQGPWEQAAVRGMLSVFHPPAEMRRKLLYQIDLYLDGKPCHFNRPKPRRSRRKHRNPQ